VNFDVSRVGAWRGRQVAAQFLDFDADGEESHCVLEDLFGEGSKVLNLIDEILRVVVFWLVQNHFMPHRFRVQFHYWSQRKVLVFRFFLLQTGVLLQNVVEGVGSVGFALEGLLDLFQLFFRIRILLIFVWIDCGDWVEEFLSLLVDGDVEGFFKFEEDGTEMKSFPESVQGIMSVFKANLMILILWVKTRKLQEVEGKLVLFRNERLNFIELTLHVPFDFF
jgi:hypothetical protein